MDFDNVGKYGVLVIKMHFGWEVSKVKDTLRDTCIYMIYPSVEIHLEICFSLCKLAIIKLDYKYSFTKIIIDR